MENKELIERLRIDAEWAEGQEWETPICLWDDLREAISALRAQQSPATLDGSRLEGCFICKDATYLDGDVCVSGTHYVELSEFDFCPHCGRPLTEEAWAELERRIGGNDGKTDD